MRLFGAQDRLLLMLCLLLARQCNLRLYRKSGGTQAIFAVFRIEYAVP